MMPVLGAGSRAGKQGIAAVMRGVPSALACGLPDARPGLAKRTGGW